MKTKIIVHAKRVKIYFKERNHFIRYNTEIPVLSVSEFYRNDPENLFRNDSPKYEEYNDRIELLQKLIEEIIDENLGKIGITLNNEFVRVRIKTTHDDKCFTKKLLIEYYQDFLTYKSKYYEENNASKISIKDYISLKQSLMDYQLHTNKVYNIEDLNFEWAKSFLSFLTQKHKPFVYKKDVDEKVLVNLEKVMENESVRNRKLRCNEDKIRFLTKGEICDNTTQKRFDNLNEFVKFLNKNKISSWDPEEMSDLRKLYKAYRPLFTTLTIEETQKLYELKIDFDYEDKRYEFVRDIFIFMAFTSFRYSDVETFDKKRNITGNKIYKYAQKTEKYDTMSIADIIPPVRSILEKYDYKINRYSNTLFNRYLTECLEKSGLFNEIVFKKKRVKGRQVPLEGIPRYKEITTHTGRRTCITNLLAQGATPIQVMTVSGHRSSSMVLRYNDRLRGENRDNSNLTKLLDFTNL
jgi:integrase